MSNKRILLGRIVGAHGIKGEVQIRAYTQSVHGLTDYGALETADGQRIVISQARATNKGVLARIDGVADRTAAERLRGVDLYVDRSKLPEPDDGAYYHEDLIGLQAVDTQGNVIGRVEAVENYGAGDILVIAIGPGKEPLLVPFRDAFVPEVNIKGGLIVVVPPVMVGDDDGVPDAGSETV